MEYEGGLEKILKISGHKGGRQIDPQNIIGKASDSVSLKKKSRKKSDFIKCLLKVFISATIVRGKFLLFISFYCTKNEVFH